MDNDVKQIISIASGKGGTGKSFLTANIGAVLSLSGYKVIIIDTDFGCPNLNNFAAVKKPEHSLSEFFLKEITSLEDIVIDTSIENLKIIACGSKAYGVANLHYFKKASLMRQILKLDADFVLIDSGPGVNYNAIDFFNLSDHGVMILNTDIISKRDTLIFLKTALYRKILQTIKKRKRLRKKFDEYLKEEKRDAFDIDFVLKWIWNIDSEMKQKLRELILNYNPKFIINKARDQNAENVTQTLIRLAKNHLHVKLDYLGMVGLDSNIEKSLNDNQIFFVDYPDSPAAEDLYNIVTSTYTDNKVSYAEFRETDPVDDSEDEIVIEL
jgi:flagellar biosynthesis protein FlhG